MPDTEVSEGPWTKYQQTAPESSAPEGPWTKYQEPPEPEGSTFDSIKQGAGNFLAGLTRGAGSIGATIMAPKDMLMDAIDGKGLSLESNRQRRADMDSALGNMGAETDSWMYKGGKLTGEIAGTAGVGGVMANGVRAVGATKAMSGLEPLTNAVAAGLQSGGFRVGELAGTKLGAATRLVTGAASGGASAALVDPEDAALGAAIGGALPGVVKAATSLTNVGPAMRKLFGAASPEVRDLALRAEELGIKIPADRLLDSKALNAMAASLKYIPLSGRTATEEAMESQLNKALSRTFGQNSSNVTTALRVAQEKLGGKFEKTLTENGVNFDRELLDDLATVYNKAETELGSEALRPIESKIKEIVAKGEEGMIDGRAAYNIKRDLDRLGKSNTPNAWHAVELKRVLMEALDRSLGTEAAAEFANVRRQYGNMLSLEKLAKNGVDGEISVARLANLSNINNAELQEIADIAAQFVKPREGMHGAAQRAVLGVTAAALGGVGAAGAGMAAGRTANTVLNSKGVRNAILNPMTLASEPATMGAIGNSMQRALPIAGVAMAADAAAQDTPATPGSAPYVELRGMAQSAPEPDHIADIGAASNIDDAIKAAGAAINQQPKVESKPMVIQAPEPPPPPPVPEKVSMTIPGGTSTEPDSVWFGRRGDGYQGAGDAFMAMRARQKLNPDLEWKVEQMPNGRYRIAGYGQAEQMAPEGGGMDESQGMAFEAIPRGDGTLAIRGNAEAIRQMLAQQGIRAIPMRDGVIVGTSQAQAAMGALQQLEVSA